MSQDKKIANAIGALFVITMILGMIDAYTVAPLLQLPLVDYRLHAAQFHVGAFAILFMSLGVVGIAILLYPILERHSKVIALTYLSARVMECLLLIVGVVAYLLLLRLSDGFVKVDTPAGSFYPVAAKLTIEARYAGYQVAMIILSIASMMMCYLLYKTRLIHRAIAVVGILAYMSVLVSAPLDILGWIDTNGAGGILYVPGALFELLLLPGWLFIKGFGVSGAKS